MGDALPAVKLGRKVKSIEAGDRHVCAILDNNTVKCWGRNNRGQLGLGDTENRGHELDELGSELPAIDLGTGRKAKSVSAGSDYTCAVLDNGTMKCWGWNSSGILGYGDTANRGDNPEEMGDYLPAVAVGGSHRVLAASTGLGLTCALLDDYSLRCWGWNTFGEMGLGNKLGFGGYDDKMVSKLPPIALTG
jgi:alpha-tubulin suppressor-like RCC1 family protein